MKGIDLWMSMASQYINPIFTWSYAHPTLIIAGGALASFFVSVRFAKSHKLVCSACHSKSIHRSHRRGFFERMLGVFRIYPFRCEDCRTRFWKLT